MVQQGGEGVYNWEQEPELLDALRKRPKTRTGQSRAEQFRFLGDEVGLGEVGSVETAMRFSACLDTLLLHDLERDDHPRVPLEAFATFNLYHFGAEAREPFIRLEPVSVPLAHRHSNLPPPSMVAAGGGGKTRRTSRPRVLLSQKSCRKCLHNTMMGSKPGTLAKPLPHLCRSNRAPSC